MTLAYDRRITPARPDLAAAHLRGRIEALRYAEPRARMVVAASTPLRPEPRLDRGIDTELLRGEGFAVYESDPEGWSWGQAASDGYVGWLPTAALGAPEPATHRIAALRSFVFPGPSIKLPIAGVLPFGAKVAVRAVADEFVRVAEGYVWAGHLSPAGTLEPDFVAVAERFLGVPYLWGGRTSLGLDCSALVQTALAAAGVPAPRDSDQQAASLGTPLGPDMPLSRGDLVFWEGHVGLMRDASTLLHASGHTMSVQSEPLQAARVRILAETGRDVSVVRRLQR